jgi:hypothetical protein
MFMPSVALSKKKDECLCNSASYVVKGKICRGRKTLVRIPTKGNNSRFCELRDPMQKITDYILSKAGVKEKAEVVDLDSRRAVGT